MYRHFFRIKSVARDTGYYDLAFELSKVLMKELEDIKLASFLRYLYFKCIFNI